MVKVTFQGRNEKKTPVVNIGQIYAKDGDFYMVTKAISGWENKYNLTNLSSGNRWTEELHYVDLQKKIKDDNFKYIDVEEIIVKEKK